MNLDKILNYDFSDKDKQYWIDFIDSHKSENKMSGWRILELINFYSSKVDTKNCYLEVGTYAGASLCAAAMNNKTKCYGVDNFSQKFGSDKVEQFLVENIKKYTGGNAKYFKSDYIKFLQNYSFQPVEFYFFDGPHDEESQYTGLKLALPHLYKGGSLIFVDDAADGSHVAVKNASDRIISENSKIKRIRLFDSPLGKEGFHAGLEVLYYEE